MKVIKDYFVSLDGAEINLLYLIPETAVLGKTPAVLFQPSNGGTVDDYLWILEPLCQFGYFVFGIYENILQEDMERALKILKENPLVDSTRIMVMIK